MIKLSKMKNEFLKILRPLAIIGNALFILWIVYNAIDERGKGQSPVATVALSALVGLLIINLFLLSQKSSKL